MNIKTIIIASSLLFFIIVLSILIFKPYMKYDKIVEGDTSYIIRTNIITGYTEILSPYTLKWLDKSDMEANKNALSSK